MIVYNWKTRMYEVWAGLRPMVVADFWRYEDAVAYLNVRHIKC